MESRKRMKLGMSDRVILGVGYTLLGLFVLVIFVPWFMWLWRPLWTRTY